MQYKFREAEAKWQKHWQENGTYKVSNQSDKPKYYVLDMFPYPSGAGLHMGHPLGYIATDIFSRYKRMKGFNVLHPMGFDAFGLPAEQYAIETGQHPEITTAHNIKTFRGQLERIGFNYDWSRAVKTSDPAYYKWTQWIFLQLFKSWYNPQTNRSEDIELLVKKFEENGCSSPQGHKVFSADEWKTLSETDRQSILMNYRLAYQAESEVWYCEALGTVLANDEVKDGVSERGGHPVEKKKLRQWFLRITAFADRLLEGLERIDWPHSLKEMQKNWIGRSTGASILFGIDGYDLQLEIFTTRPDTIFGATFMVLAPEHSWVDKITTPEQKEEVENYQKYVSTRSERDRMSEVRKVTGANTGAFAIHPFSGEKIPIHISEYVLADYGTGAIMAVPSDDERDEAFAEKFNIPIIDVIDKSNYPGSTKNDKEGILINSDFINGMEVPDAIDKVISEVEKRGIGQGKINYRLRDAGFSRQRYWGEPFPIVYSDGDYPIALKEEELPLTLPAVQSYEPTGDGRSPLAGVTDWVNTAEGVRETDTMPGYAGSSWYFLRYMDPHNEKEPFSKEAESYWQDVDVYIGGSEHAVGHLLYARMWQKFLFDKGLVSKDEPFKKLINQGMIQGLIEFLYLKKEKTNGHSHFVCARKIGVDYNESDFIRIPIDIRIVEDYGSQDSYLNINSIEKFIEWRPEFSDAIFECGQGSWQQGKFTSSNSGDTDSHLFTQSEIGKMGKRYYNSVDPNEVVDQHGADVLRLYQMFLGPLEQAKPWDTKGISGVARFVKRFWGLFHQNGAFEVSNDEPTLQELKILHKTIEKVSSDVERFSFNTCVSAFMVGVNELASLKCNKKGILEPLSALLAPFAPHITEEVWLLMGNSGSVHHSTFPDFNADYTRDDEVEYPVSINGKLRAKIMLASSAEKDEAEKEALAHPDVLKWTEGKEVKRFIFVKGRIINIVV